MPKPPSEQYKWDNEGATIPASNVKAEGEGSSSVNEGTETSDGPGTRKTPSESVGGDSLKAHVKRNIGTFERTEGRL